MAQDPAPWAPTSRPDLGVFVPRERRLTPLLAWLGCLAGAILLLVWLGDGRLAAPELTAPTSWGAWARDLGPAATTIAVLRIVGLALAWYLVGVTTVSAAAHAVEAAGMVRIADALAVGPVRSVVQQALGIGLAVGVVVAAVPTGGRDSIPEVSSVTSVVTDDDGRPTPVAVHAGVAMGVRPPSSSPPTGAVGAALGPGAGAGAVLPVPAPLAPSAVDRTGEVSAARTTGASDVSSAPVVRHRGGTSDSEIARAASDTAAAADVALRTVRVTPGDHLWGIAEADLVDTLGRPPTEVEVAAHWRRVIAINADRLVVVTNPDLLFPGQEIVLPDVEVSR